MIRGCDARDVASIWTVINDGAKAYTGVIPADRVKDPYMTEAELRHEMEEGVSFWGEEEDGQLLGVMGMQEVKDVTLIRHAYVRTEAQGRGIGGRLLGHLLTRTERPVLIGTWAAAAWAVRFYERYGFGLVSAADKDRLLKTYWTVPERQIETSVVLADARWRAEGHA